MCVYLRAVRRGHVCSMAYSGSNVRVVGRRLNGRDGEGKFRDFGGGVGCGGED